MAEYAFWEDATARAHNIYVLAFQLQVRVSAVCEAALPLAKNALHSPASNGKIFPFCLARFRSPIMERRGPGEAGETDGRVPR